MKHYLIAVSAAMLSFFAIVACNKENPDSEPKVMGGVPGLPVPDMVDLGLSVKWASFNLGASKPEEFGGYYQWAGTDDVTDKSISVDLTNCPYHTGSADSSGWTKYIPAFDPEYWSGKGSPDNKDVLALDDDVAHAALGGKWRIPTNAEWKELQDKCTFTWTRDYNGTGVAGRIVTSNVPGYTNKSIFLPAAGYRDKNLLSNSKSEGCYWSSSLHTGVPYCAWMMYFTAAATFRNYYDRYFGESVRPVSD